MKKKITIGTMIGLICILGIIFLILQNAIVGKKEIESNPGILRAMNYAELHEEDEYVENCPNIKFSAFFTKDLNGDGYAEKLLGSCNRIKETDTLYMDINVLSSGSLKNGKIEIESNNFTYQMEMLKDTVLKNNYVSDNVRTIELNDMTAGTQKLIYGTVKSAIRNKEDYTRINKVKLTGTYVADNGEEIEISKTIDLTIDWYGAASVALTGESKYYDETEFTKGEDISVSFEFTMKEQQKELIMQKNIIDATIPALYGEYPIEVKVLGVPTEQYEYDEENHILHIENKTYAYTTDYTVELIYPKECYEAISTGSTIIESSITGYSICDNNQNEEFENPYVTEESTARAIINIDKLPGIAPRYHRDVQFVDMEYSVYPKKQYIMPKKDFLEAYDAEEDEDSNVLYSVEWFVLRGSDMPAEVVTLKDYPDGGDAMDGTYMEEFTNNIGIYFGRTTLIPEDGIVCIYNDETDELIKELKEKEWEKYDKENPLYYEQGIRDIRVEINKDNPKANSALEIYNIREVDIQKAKNVITREQMENVRTITTTLMVDNIAARQSIELGVEKSYNTISVQPKKISTTETKPIDEKIIITVPNSNVVCPKWKNGTFLIKVPTNIIYMTLEKVELNSKNVTLDGYELYKENGQYFIKILTSNEEETAGFGMVIDTKILANPMISSSTQNFELYSINEYHNAYYQEVYDMYDIDGDENRTEIIGYTSDEFSINAPSAFSTVETVSNYNEENEITIAPNVAEVTKTSRKATINVEFVNNYINTVENVMILGKVPYEGNTYSSGEDLKSEFTAYMENTGIRVPEELQDVAKIYYSQEENPNYDLEDKENGWRLLKDIENINTVKAFLIVLENHEVITGRRYTFSYDVKIPEEVTFNEVTYSCHSIYFELNTDGGKLETVVQPNKVGIRMVRYYDFEISKYKEGTSLGVPGAVYELAEVEDEDKKENARILNSNAEGKMTLKNLRVNQVYELKEIQAPENYELNEKSIRFYVKEKTNGELETVVLSDEKFATEAKIENSASGRDVLYANIEDRPKVSFNITKVDGKTGTLLTGVIFNINGTNYTTKEGKVEISGLKVGEEYELYETYAKGYYHITEPIPFVIEKDSEGNLYIDTESEVLKNVQISNTDDKDLIQVNVEIQNIKIPTYNLQVIKVNETNEGIKLSGAKYELSNENAKQVLYYTTDENGIINMEDLYQNEEAAGDIGKYILKEVEAPNGYIKNSEEISFWVKENDEGILEIEVENIDKLETVRDIKIEGNTIQLVLQNKPLFKITKVDSETGEKLVGADFIIYELKEDGTVLDYAKDAEGNYIGIKDENNQYIVTTNSEGEITAPLRNGNYKLIEVNAPIGYEKNDDVEVFSITANNKIQEEVGEITFERDYEVDFEEIEISSVEDLVELSNRVASGETSARVKLMNDIDFNDDNCYEQGIDNVSFEDINGDGIVKGLKEELTDREGTGFIAIGDTDNRFSGIFDGQGHEIKNLYTKETALFGYAQNVIIKNLGVSGEIETEKGFASGILGYAAGKVYIYNCYNSCNITSSGYYVGGIAGIYELKDDNGYLTIEECCNSGSINGKEQIGGLVGYVNGNGAKNTDEFKVTIIDSYNTGNVITDKNYYVGGLIGDSGANTQIVNSYNTGNIEGLYYLGGCIGMARTNIYIDNVFNEGNILGGDAYTGGLVGYIYGNENIVKNSHNAGDILSEGAYGEIGGIIGLVTKPIEISNCYNSGNIIETSTSDYPRVGGLIGQMYSDVHIVDSYNTGNISNFGYYVGGLVGYGSKDVIERSNNYGDITVKPNNYSYVGGISACSQNEIRNCKNTGKITVFSKTSSGYENVYVGGISGSGGTIENCCNEGEIVGNDNIYVTMYAGGIIGTGGTIINSYNTGNITINNYERIYVGGISGGNGTTSYCYNIGNISNMYDDINDLYPSEAMIGGIAGSSGNVNYCYNLGNIQSKCSEGGRIYIGGIGGNEIVVKNAYNTGDIKSNVGDISENCYAYIGGINGYGGSAENVYNIGSIYNKEPRDKENGNTGAIAGISTGTSTVKKAYYLENIDLIGMRVNKNNATSLSEEYMKSREFYNTLSEDAEGWFYIENQYPTIDMGIVISSESTTELTIPNKKAKYDIRTEIGENDLGNRDGGEITGTYTEEYPEAKYNYKKFLETVEYGMSNTSAIEINPDDGYKVASIKINGEAITFEEDENDNVVLPVGSINRITKDQDIVVTFLEKENVLTINKTNEQGNPLEGVEFSIEQIEDREEISNEVGEIVNSEVNKAVPNYEEDVTSDTLETIVQNSGYSFEKVGDKYISNNAGRYESMANSYMKIDLTGMEGQYQVIVNAEHDSTYSSIGYATINQSIEAPEYNDADGRFIYITKATAAQEYQSELLEGNNVYYLHFGFRKSASTLGTDAFIINDIKVNKVESEVKATYGKTTSPWFISSIEGYGNYTQPKQLYLDLKNMEAGKYFVVVNAGISSEVNYDLGYATITSTSVTTTPSYSQTSGRFMYISGEVPATDYRSQELEAGNEYYLWCAYRKDKSGNSGMDRLTVNTVTLYRKNETDVSSVLSEMVANGYNPGFSTDENKYTSNNSNKYYTTASAYIPIDLSDKDGEYKVVLNAEVHNKAGSSKAYAIITDSTEIPSYNVTAGRFMYESGTTALAQPTDYTSETLQGGEGKKYYLHIGYFNSNINTANEDKLIINDIKVYKAKNEKFIFENTEGKYVSNNQGYASTVAHSYIPIDLTQTKGKYNFRVNAEISSEAKDYGYVIITKTPDLPSVNDSANRLVYISGETEAKDYIRILEAGEVYYVHFIYNKNEKVHSGDDKFTINEIELSYNTDEFYSESNMLTDAKGQIVRGVKFGTYKITETKTIDGYTLNTESVIHVVGNDTDNNINIVNKAQKAVTVHQYLKGTGEEFGNQPVKIKEDTKKKLDNGTEYSVVPQIKVGEYTLIKDEDGQYIIPENAIGVMGDNDIDVYYYYEAIEHGYTINYYYDGELDANETIVQQSKVNEVISEYPDKIREGYVLEKTNNIPLTVSENNEENVIDIYYVSEYKITTEAVEHDEEYSDGSIKKVTGGQITGQGEEKLETVHKGKNSKKIITITPDENYEISKVEILKGIDTIELPIKEMVLDNGTIELSPAGGYFKDVVSDIHVKAEFRKKTSVIVKYMDDETKEELVESENIVGYEGQNYTPTSKVIDYYEKSELGITDESNNKLEEENLKMYADTTTIICWYTRVKSGIIVRHIEIDEQDIKDGLNTSSGKEIESETLTGGVNLEQNTLRKSYERYISVDGPVLQDENIIVVGKDENNRKITYLENKTLEVRYYYEKQYKISLSDDPIDGGTVEMEGQENYEMVNNRGENIKDIVIKPEYGYKVKKVLVNEIPIDFKELEDKNHTVVLESGYFTDVQEDKTIKVEFEKISTKVIVQYLENGESNTVIEEEEKLGYVNDEYEIEPKEIEGYELDEEKLPENAKGKMTEEIIIVRFYYNKEKTQEKVFKITTIAKKFKEIDKYGNIIISDAGTITGADKEVVEIVKEGEDSKEKIIIEAKNGFRISKITINGIEYDFGKATDKLEMPIFEKMQEDKHIEVEFEKIPATITIKYVDDKTGEEIFDAEIIKGYINDRYVIKERYISNYKINTERLPINMEGKIDEKEMVIVLYYTKIEDTPEIPQEPSNPIVPEKPIIPETPNDDEIKEPESVDVSTGDNIGYYFIVMIISGTIMAVAIKKNVSNK